MGSRSFNVKGNSVLIETYWNVNNVMFEFTGDDIAVLIETYWNVNNCEWREKRK